MISPQELQQNIEEEEMLFYVDRNPSNIGPVKLEPSKSVPKVESNPEDFIRLSFSQDQSNDNELKSDEETDRGKTHQPTSQHNDIKSDDETDRGKPLQQTNETNELKSDDETDRGKTLQPTKQTNELKSDDEGDKGEQLDALFIVEDRNPVLSGQNTASTPKYRISDSFKKLMDDKPQSKRNKLANACWNCKETTHALRDCPYPRNHAQIAKSRKEFQDSKGSTPVYKRYHVEETQKYGHFVPGQLSEELRRCLGLDPGQIPSHVYMMRRLGYPPGWLIEAKVSHSGIAMFDGQGNEVADPAAEAGQVVEEGSLDKYDVRKIFHYPGFNVPPPPGSFDDSAYWGVPPLSRLQSVETMLEKLSGRFVGGYKRKKLSLHGVSPLDESSQSIESQDMEYEELNEKATELPEDNCKFVPPLPDNELPPPPPSELPPPPLAESHNESMDTNNDSQSQLSTSVEDTSILDLEDQKKLLLAELNDVSPVCGTPESRIGKVKSSVHGTPILKSVSPYARLPAADKFSVNICDVINFENLPDSTGKYENMRGILSKVRNTLSKINNEL